MIKIKSLQHSYNDQITLSFQDWDINQGDRWLMLGDSGSGKTTLLHILTGLLKPAHGEVIVNNTAIYQLSEQQLDRFRGNQIGMIFQRPHLIKSLTVMENLMLARSFAGKSSDKRRINDVLASLDIQNKVKSYPSQLSEGQLQRVSIARSVINKPSLLIADEPTSSLDDRNAESVLQLLTDQAQQNGSTLIIATHDSRVKSKIQQTYLVKA